jgi:hypothetical protein
MVTSSKVLLPQTVSIRPSQLVASVPPEIAVSESSTTEPLPYAAIVPQLSTQESSNVIAP